MMNNTKPLELLEFKGTRRVPFISQTEISECGLACLAMVSSYYGNKIDISSIRRIQTTGYNGMNLEQMIMVANSLELASRALKCPLDEIDKLSLPCIVHWDLNHFVVLTKVKRNYVYINDPALSKRKLSLEKFSDHFTGIVLELTPTTNFKKRDQRAKMRLTQLWSKISGLTQNLITLFAFSIVLQMIALANPYYMQWVIDEVLVSYDQSLLMVLAIGFSLLLIIDIFTTTLRSYMILRLSSVMNMQMGVNLLRHLLRLPMPYFEKRHIGDIVSRFGSLGVIKERITTGLVETIIDGVMSITVLAMLLLYSIKLTTIVLASVLLYLVLRMLTYPTLKRYTEELIQASAKEESNFLENIRGIQTIKLHTSEATRQSLWQNRYADVINCDIRIGKLNISFDFIDSIIFGFQNIIIIYVAAVAVMEGNLTVGMLFAFMAYKSQFTGHINSFIEQMIAYRILRLHLERISDISTTEIEANLDGKALLEEVSGKIKLENVSFRYGENEPWIIRNLTLTINAKESVAITGESGCGKSTLIKIMLGLLSPNEGCVLLDDIDINKIGLINYRKFISTVMQDDTLLSGSVSDNITFFDTNHDLERVRVYANLAAISDDIAKMPMGYNTLVGDMGNQFSGGQVQRILLARALYKQPKVLFLDEATSHLDNKNESYINDNIKKLSITKIIVAHREETIKKADRVVKMHKGRIEILKSQ